MSVIILFHFSMKMQHLWANNFHENFHLIKVLFSIEKSSASSSEYTCIYNGQIYEFEKEGEGGLMLPGPLSPLLQAEQVMAATAGDFLETLKQVDSSPPVQVPFLLSNTGYPWVASGCVKGGDLPTAAAAHCSPRGTAAPPLLQPGAWGSSSSLGCPRASKEKVMEGEGSGTQYPVQLLPTATQLEWGRSSPGASPITRSAEDSRG